MATDKADEDKVPLEPAKGVASKPEPAKPEPAKGDADKSDPIKAFEPGKAPGATGPTPDKSSPKPATTSKPATSPSSNQSEWTLSDSRKPLEKADETGAPVAGAAIAAADEKLHIASEPASAAAKTKDDKASGDKASSDKTATAPKVTPASPVTTTAPEREPEKRSLLPIAAGLVIGAIIGAGSAAIVYANHSGSTGGGADVSALSSRVDALEKRPGADTAVAKLQDKLTDLSNQVAGLQTKGGNGSSPAAPPAAPDLGPIQERVAALQTSIDALKSQAGDTKSLQARIAALEGDVAGAKRESSAAQAGMAGVEDRQKLLANKVMVPALAVVADSLVQQIDQGQPYGAQVDALTALGADATKIAVLRQNAEKGVPSAKALAAKFEPLAGPIVATANKAPANAGFVDRLKSGMFSMVSVRNADDTSGTDLPSRVAHIKVALAHDDIADAIATWNQLPADAKAKGEAWAALAKTSADAMAAARALQHDAIVALAAKKS